MKANYSQTGHKLYSLMNITYVFNLKHKIRILAGVLHDWQNTMCKHRWCEINRNGAGMW